MPAVPRLRAPLRVRSPAALLAGLVLLGGCAGTPVAPVETPPPLPPETTPEETVAPEPPPMAEPVRPSPNISIALREESARAAAGGDPGRAIALLERAIRIEPGRADLWLDLAELYLQTGDPAQAEQLARKARALAPGDEAVAERAARIDARVRALRQTG